MLVVWDLDRSRLLMDVSDLDDAFAARIVSGLLTRGTWICIT